MIAEQINICPDAEVLSESFSTFFRKMLNMYPHINVALSGGTTPNVIFDYWAENCRDTITWNRVSFFWGDERCVPPDNEMSNYGMAKKHLFDRVPEIPEENIFRIHGENEPEEEAERYGKLLGSKLVLRNKIPCFELVMLGLGGDGHTLSIFPHEISKWKSKNYCIVGGYPDNNRKRVSLSGTIVNNACHVAFLVTGAGKAETVREIIQSRKQFINTYPAAKVNPKNGYLYWFLDNKAARLL